MSVLDSFLFLLRADTRDATRDITEVGDAFDDAREDGERATREIGDSADDMGHRLSSIAEVIKEKFAGGLTSSFAAVGSAIGIAAVAGMGFSEVLDRLPELINKVNDAASVGVDITSYDAMSRVFQQNGVDADGFRDSMIDLNEAMGEAASDAESGKAKSFKTFGVSLKDAAGHAKNADQVMLELSKSMEKMSKQEAIFQIKALGITDNKVIQTLLQGNSALKEQIELQKQKFALSEKDAEQLNELEHAQNMLNATIDGMVDKFAVMLAPALTMVTDGVRELVDWFIEHSRVIKVAAGVITTLLLPTIWSAAYATGAWAAATIAATWPFIAIGAAVAAFILVLEDLWAYYDGADSVIGRFAAKHEMLKDVLEGLRLMAKGLMQFLSDMWNNPEKALGDFQSFMHTVWTNMVGDTKKIFTELWEWIKGMFNELPIYLAKKMAEGIASLPGGEKLLSTLGVDIHAGEKKSDSDDQQMAAQLPSAPGVAAAGAASSFVGMAAASPVIGVGAGRAGNITNTSQQHIDKVEVNVPSGNPQEVRTAVAEGMNDHLKNTAQSFNDGVSH